MRHDDNCNETAVAVRRRRRGESCRSFTCVSPWYIFSRLFNGYKSKISRNREERKREMAKMDWESDVRRKSEVMRESMNHEVSSCHADEDLAEIRKEDFFKLGVGFGLIYLASASRNELNKMMDLHKKFEVLLQNFQIEIQETHQDKEEQFLPSNTSLASCSNNGGIHDATLYYEEHDSINCISSNNDKCHEIGYGTKSMRMDQLEAELQAEFDRMQLQMDNTEVNVEDSAPEESQSTNIKEVIIDQPDDVYYSVPPTELERRLHELLESRQQKRIDELESALEHAFYELRAKESELDWWKDTARLVSHHLRHIPGLSVGNARKPFGANGMRILSLEYEKSLV